MTPGKDIGDEIKIAIKGDVMGTIDPKQIKKMHLEQFMTIKEISAELGVHDRVVIGVMRDNNIKPLSNLDRAMIKFKPHINAIRRLYWDEFKTMKQIAGILGIRQMNVVHAMNYYDIPKRKYTNKCSSLDHNLICRRYINNKLSTGLLAKEFKCNAVTIANILRSQNIKLRSYADASSAMNDRRMIVFTEDQRQLIFGSMLGDACLHRSIMKSNKTDNKLETYKLIFAHSIKQLEYLEHKRSVLGGSRIGNRQSGHGSIIKHFAFCHTPSLRPIAEICHDSNHKKRITQEWLNLLTWKGIAYWYMDDGSLLIDKEYGRPILTFHTNSYSSSELDLLTRFLRGHGLDTRHQKADGNPGIILSSRHQTEARSFLKNMKPYIIPSMEYKIRAIL